MVKKTRRLRWLFTWATSALLKRGPKTVKIPCPGRNEFRRTTGPVFDKPATLFSPAISKGVAPPKNADWELYKNLSTINPSQRPRDHNSDTAASCVVEFSGPPPLEKERPARYPISHCEARPSFWMAMLPISVLIDAKR